MIGLLLKMFLNILELFVIGFKGMDIVPNGSILEHLAIDFEREGVLILTL